MRRLMILVMLVATACSGGSSDDKDKQAVEPPPFDAPATLAAPPPALATEALRQVAEPGHEAEIDALAARETAQHLRVLAAAEKEDKRTGGPGKVSPARYGGGFSVRPAVLRTAAGAFEIGTAGAQLVTLAGGLSRVANPNGVAGSIGGTVGGVAIKLTVNADGTTSMSIETEVALSQLFLSGGSKVSIRGNTCPDANGKVDYTVEIKVDGKGKASSSTYGRVLTAHVTATVDDNADIVEGNAELVSETSTGSGKVTTAVGMQLGAGGAPGDITSDVETSGTVADKDATASQGAGEAISLARATLSAAEARWKNGACVKLSADNPGSVKPKSTTTVKVAVSSSAGGGAVPAKVTIALTGEKEVDKTVIPKAPDSFVYTAPDDKDKEATIELRATSRQGRDSLTLSASTKEEDFKVNGPFGFASMTGTKCGGPFGTWNVHVQGDVVTEDLTWTFVSPALTAKVSGTRVVQGYTFQESGMVTLDPEAGTLTFRVNSGGDASVSVTKGSFCKKT